MSTERKPHTRARKALAALGIGMISAAAVLTVTIAPSQTAHADNTYGGAGATTTPPAHTPPTPDTPSATPAVKAQPFEGGEGNHH